MWHSNPFFATLANFMQPETVRTMIEHLKNADSKIRLAAIDSLEPWGPNSAAAVPALTTALRDRSCMVRRKAAEALGRIGPAAQTAVDALNHALKDRIHTVRDAAWSALAHIRESSPGVPPAEA